MISSCVKFSICEQYLVACCGIGLATSGLIRHVIAWPAARAIDTKPTWQAITGRAFMYPIAADTCGVM